MPFTFWRTLRETLEMIKFQHSLFALPFALTAMLAAAGGLPEGATILWIVVAAVAARSMAMAHNRLVDRKLDARNPRTANRALPAGRLSPVYARTLTVLGAAVFVGASAMLNGWCLLLCPMAIFVLLFYSYSKRFTPYSHLLLGICLALAPLGAWIAVKGNLEGLPLLLALGVCLWTAGFDVLYSLQDMELDRRQGLYSFPARWGEKRSLQISRLLHGLAALSLALFCASQGFGPWGWAGWILLSGLLAVEHRLVARDRQRYLNAAFFTCNALGSIAFFLLAAVEWLG